MPLPLLFEVTTTNCPCVHRVIDGLEALDELEKMPINAKNFRPLTDSRINKITIHANPLAG
jgi:peptidyl-prolyl cis-trans isomerase-like 3